ncbi:MAG: hypothetical protein MZU95_09430 [Desulfomicrobium escambiense]|nr:hypothetical protein [Desulfomicrobium escambiense]
MPVRSVRRLHRPGTRRGRPPLGGVPAGPRADVMTAHAPANRPGPAAQGVQPNHHLGHIIW